MGRKERRELEIGDYELMDMPTSLRDAEWKDFKDIKQAPQIAHFLERLHVAFKDGDSLFIAGPQLSGKSYVCAYIAKLFRSYSYTVQWGRAIDIQDNISEKVDWSLDEGSFILRYRNVDVLVVDGLGTEIQAVGRGRNRVKELIEYRRAWNKLTIINSHLSPPEMDETYHKGYASWIASLFIVIEMEKLVMQDLEKKHS